MTKYPCTAAPQARAGSVALGSGGTDKRVCPAEQSKQVARGRQAGMCRLGLANWVAIQNQRLLGLWICPPVLPSADLPCFCEPAVL
jgi:hypothetical protein